MKTYTVALIAALTYSAGYWFGREGWHPKPVTEILHAPKEILRINSNGDLVPFDPVLQQAVDKVKSVAYAKGVNDALTGIALHDLERRLDNRSDELKPITWGDRGEIVAKRLNVIRTP